MVGLGIGRKLVMYIFSWGSNFDRSITPQLAAGNTVAASSSGGVANVSITAPFSEQAQILPDKAITPVNVTSLRYDRERFSNVL